ncbi:MAG TPA: S8 family serine peptidase, partial [Longimicrobiales bacterium]
MSSIKRLGAVAILLLAGVPASAQAPRPSERTPDPRVPALRRELALHPRERRAVWIDLDPRAAASSLAPALSPEALALRERKGVGILDNDRPIAPALVRRLERAGARIRVLDRWSRSVSAEVDSAAAARISRMAAVRAMEPVLRLRVLGLEAGKGSAPLSPAHFFADSTYGILASAVRQLNIPAAHALGYTGVGVRIGMLDTGFDRGHEALQPMKVAAQYDFIWRDTIVRNQPRDTFNQASHGTGTASVLGGNKPGTILGAAYGATFLLAKTEVDNLAVDSHQDEDRWVQGVLWMDSVGVDVVSSSLGYRYDFPDTAAAPMYREPNGLLAYTCAAMNGHTTRTSIAAAQLARRRILLVTAMGNDGTVTDPTTHTNACTLSAPADADSIIAVGAVDSAGRVAFFSSRGPTADLRHKPELSARGVGVPHAVAGTLSSYAVDNGTSYATPLIAGAAALVLQAWPSLSPMGIRDALTLSAPNRQADDAVGFGVPDVASAIAFPQGLLVLSVSPADPFGAISSIAPTFSWQASSVSLRLNPVIYRVDVASDSAFRNILYSDTVANTFRLQTRVPLKPTNTLWWRVVATAFTPDGGTIRRVASPGAVGPLSLPHWVRLANLNAARDTFTDTARPTFRWISLAAPAPVGPLTFRLQVLNDSGRIVFSDTTRADSLAMRQSLDYNVPYRWR